MLPFSLNLDKIMGCSGAEIMDVECGDIVNLIEITSLSLKKK